MDGTIRVVFLNRVNSQILDLFVLRHLCLAERGQYVGGGASVFLKNHTREEFKISYISKKVVVTQKWLHREQEVLCISGRGDLCRREAKRVAGDIPKIWDNRKEQKLEITKQKKAQPISTSFLRLCLKRGSCYSCAAWWIIAWNEKKKNKIHIFWWCSAGSFSNQTSLNSWTWDCLNIAKTLDGALWARLGSSFLDLMAWNKVQLCITSSSTAGRLTPPSYLLHLLHRLFGKLGKNIGGGSGCSATFLLFLWDQETIISSVDFCGGCH